MMRLFAVIHEHRHGVDVFHVLANEEPDPERVITAYGSTYEPCCEETASISEVSLTGSTLVPTADQDEAGFYPVS